MKRLNYLDSLRGVAIVAMIINHVGHFLTAQPVTNYGIYFSVYWTVGWAAPLFLFVAGYSLALGEQKKRELAEVLNFRYFLLRGLMVVGLGVLLNILFFLAEEPWYFGRILLVIGVGIIGAYPLLKYLKSNYALLVALTANLVLIFCYPLTFDFLKPVALDQSVVAQVIFGEFSLYPWVLLLFIGALAGKYFLSLTSERQRSVAQGTGVVGGLLLVTWFLGSLLLGHWYLWLFKYDYNLRGFWLPSDLSWLWIFGSLMVASALLFVLRDRNYFWLRGLQTLGQNALIIYFLQFFIIKTIGGEWLQIRLTGFFPTVIADLIIIISLCYLVKSKSFAKLMALNPLKAKAKIS